MRTTSNIPTAYANQRAGGFTLVELLLSMTIFSMILLIATGVIGQMQKVWRQSSQQLEQFREARMAFESITRSLAQAKLNTYLAYRYNNGPTPTVPATQLEAPLRYARQSELQFVSGQATSLLTAGNINALVSHGMFFQASLGVSHRDGYEALNRLLCGRGYFIMHGDDVAYRPAHVTKVRSRFRLMEYRPPSEKNEIYSETPGKWFERALDQIISASEVADNPSYTRPVAENIVALIISPQVSQQDAATASKKPTWIAPNFAYDSSKLANDSLNSPQGTQHMLPPSVFVAVVAIDEASAALLEEKYQGNNPDLIPANAFTMATEFENDLANLEKALQTEKLNYRVFSSTIPLRNSKWGLMRN